MRGSRPRGWASSALRRTVIDLSLLWLSEWIVCVFFAYLLVLSRFRLGPRGRRRVLLTSLVCVAAAVMISQLRPSPALRIARDWLPAVYLVQGYWLCGLFFQRPMPGFEARLLDADRAVFRLMRVTEFLARGPRLVLEYFEFTYLLVYPLVPVSTGIFLLVGGRPEIDRFWVAILLAGFGCYGMLPWIQTRPPRSIEHEPRPRYEQLRFRRINLLVLRHGSVQVNTFPSGHASVACAAALAVGMFHPGAGVALAVLAGSITLATVLGRYHYATDSVLGVLIGAASWWIAF